MNHGRPSGTALAVASRRAAHQVVDGQPKVLDDPISTPILGPGNIPSMPPCTSAYPNANEAAAWLCQAFAIRLRVDRTEASTMTLIALDARTNAIGHTAKGGKKFEPQRLFTASHGTPR